MREALEALNLLVTNGVIKNYAIGGAIGASFFIKAAQTEDVDAFVFLPSDDSMLVSLSPIYQALVEAGGVIEREYVRFGGWPLQILTDANSLIREAIVTAIDVNYDGTPTRVFSAEYLCAVALQTGRSKDYLRLGMFLEQGAVEQEALAAMLERFGLAAKFREVRGSR